MFGYFTLVLPLRFYRLSLQVHRQLESFLTYLDFMYTRNIIK